MDEGPIELNISHSLLFTTIMELQNVRLIIQESPFYTQNTEGERLQELEDAIMSWCNLAEILYPLKGKH